jgi:MFS family permease
LAGWSELGDVTPNERAAVDPSVNRYSDYNLLFSSYTLALLGTGIAVVGISLLSFDLTGDEAGAALGVALAIKTGTHFVVAPFAAALVGHIPKKPLMIGLFVFGAATILTLPFVSEIWQLYLLIVAFTAATAVFVPTYQALVPHVLPDLVAYYRALTKARIAHELDYFASPLLAAAILLLVDHDGLFVAAALLILASAALLSRADLPAIQRTTKAQIWSETKRGFRLFSENPKLRFLIPLNFALAVVAAEVLVNTVVLVQGLFDLDERATTFALAAFGLGVVVGAVAMLPLLRHVKAQTVMIAGAASTVVGLVAGTQIGSFMSLLVMWSLLGAGYGLAMTPGSIVLRTYGLAEDRPLLYATNFSLTNASLLIAFPLAGWIGTTFHLKSGLMLLAAIAGLSTIAAFRLQRGA